jgi:hypothetical protein
MANAEITKLGADDEERLRACLTGVEIHGDALKARLARKLLRLEEQQARSWRAEHRTPPSLARTMSFFTSSSRSLVTSGLKKGLKKGPQASVPVDVVFDTFEVLCGARGGKVARQESALACAEPCSVVTQLGIADERDGRLNACFQSIVSASISKIRA